MTAFTPKVVVLTWTLPHEVSFRKFLEESSNEYWVIPLSLPAAHAARELFPSSAVLDVSDFVTPRERLAIEDQSIELCNQFWQQVVNQKSEPWLACLDYYNSGTLFFHLLYWQSLLTKIGDQLGNPAIRLHGPFSRSAISGRQNLSSSVLELCVEKAQAGGRLAARKRVVKERAMVTCGWLCNRFARFCTRAPRCARVRARKGVCLVVGLQATDRIFQGPLVSRLCEAARGAIRWIVLDEGTVSLPAHEGAGNEDAERVMNCIQPVKNLREFKWRHPLFGRLSRAQIKVRYRRALASVLGKTSNGMDVVGLAEILHGGHEFLRTEHLAISRLMERHHPTIIVSNSNTRYQLHARQWARQHNVPYVRLPHGFETHFGEHYCWDADTIGVTGLYLKNRLCASIPEWKERVEVVGGFHLARQGQGSQPEESESPSSNPWQALLLATISTIPDYPDTSMEIERDIKSLANAISAVGGILSIRAHPRNADEQALYALLKEECDKEGISLRLSDAHCSLKEAFTESAAIIVRNWGGAAVLALYSGRPLMGWLPREGYRHSSDIIRQLPLHEVEVNRVARTLASLSENGDASDDVIAGQVRLLKQLIDDPYGDSYDRVASMVLDEYNRHQKRGIA